MLDLTAKAAAKSGARSHTWRKAETRLKAEHIRDWAVARGLEFSDNQAECVVSW